MEDLWVGNAAGGSGDRTDAARPDRRRDDRGRPPRRDHLRESRGAHARVRATRPAQRSQRRVTSRCSSRRSAPSSPTACSTASPSSATSEAPIRAAPRSGSSRSPHELGLRRPRIAVVEGDDLSDERGQALLRSLLPARGRGAHLRQRQRVPGRDGDRRRARSGRADRGHRPGRRSRAHGRSRRSRTSDGRVTTGIASPARPWRATCSSAARR